MPCRKLQSQRPPLNVLRYVQYTPPRPCRRECAERVSDVRRQGKQPHRRSRVGADQAKLPGYFRDLRTCVSQRMGCGNHYLCPAREAIGKASTCRERAAAIGQSPARPTPNGQRGLDGPPLEVWAWAGRGEKPLVRPGHCGHCTCLQWGSVAGRRCFPDD